jgi:hypothetical protein
VGAAFGTDRKITCRAGFGMVQACPFSGNTWAWSPARHVITQNVPMAVVDRGRCLATKLASCAGPIPIKTDGTIIVEE